MASQHGIKLAVYLVSSLLGDQNAKVCECLLRRGTLTLQQIIQFTELSADNVRKCLLVLIHHNCVQAFAIKQDGAFGTQPKIVTNYMALFDNIIHRMRFPKFLEIVSQELDKKCGEMFEGLLQHGRLSFSQILDRHKETAKQEVSGEDDVFDRFQRLVQARFVEHCPDPLPFLEPSSKDESAAKKKAKKAGKFAEKSIETQALEEASPMESLRFSVEMDSWNDVPGCSKNTKKEISVAVGGKRKKDETELLVKDEKKVLWRVNCEEFVRLRHKACVANVKARLNEEAAIVLDAILELSRSSGTQVKADNSASLSISSIYDAVITKEGGLGMDLERIRGSLVQLGCEVPLIPIDESYSIDLKNIIEVARTEEVEPIVLKRYGREAYRMFRLVSKTGRLMLTEEISDATFVEKKDALRILLGLWQDDYLQMKKIIVRGSNQTEQMLWNISKQFLWKRVLDEMYHAALNLRLRITHEQEQVKKLVGELGRGDGRSANVRLLLESAFMNLDDAIMLFHDF